MIHVDSFIPYLMIGIMNFEALGLVHPSHYTFLCSHSGLKIFHFSILVSVSRIIQRPIHLTLIVVAELGYSSTTPDFTLDERQKMGEKVEQILKGEKEAAGAPDDA